MARRILVYFVLAVCLLAIPFLQGNAPSNAAERETNASTPERWLGIICHPLKKAERASLNLKSGLAVEEVVPQSPAEKAGITKGDILIKVADQELRKVDELVAVVATCHDKKIALQLVRDGREQSVRVTLAQRPAVIDFSGSKIPVNPVASNGDAAKRKQLMEAAKLAMARLESAKAKEDAEKPDSPENPNKPEKPQNTKAVETPPHVTRKPLEGPAVGAVRHAGTTPKVNPQAGEVFPEGGREHVQMAFLRLEPEGNQPKLVPAADPAKLLANELQLLEKRVDEMDRKLDEILKLLKADPSQSDANANKK